MPKKFVPQTDIATQTINDHFVKENLRKSQLAMDIFRHIRIYEINNDTNFESDYAESMDIAMSVVAYVYQAFHIPESVAVNQFKNWYKKMKTAQDKLGPRGIAADVFIESNIQ